MNLSDLFFWTGAFNRVGFPNIRGDELAALIGQNSLLPHSSLQPGNPETGTPDLQYGGPTSPGSPVGLAGFSFVGPENGITASLVFPPSFTVNEGFGGRDFLVNYVASLMTFGGFSPSDPGIEWEVWITLNGANTRLRTVGIVPIAATDSASIQITGTITLADGDVLRLLGDPQSGAAVSIGGRSATWSIVGV